MHDRIGLNFDNGEFMKRLVALFYLFFGIVYLTVVPSTATAQGLENITQSLHTGSSKSLGKYLQDNVTLNINNTLSDYSKNQAEQILRDFFRKNPPKEFKVLHQDEPADTNWFIIGQYHTEQAVYHVLVKGLKQEEKLVVSTIEFTKQ